MLILFNVIANANAIANANTSDFDAGGDSGNVKEELTSGVQHIYSTDHASAAVKADGSLVTWGHASYDGDSEQVKEELTSEVQHIYSHRTAFAAVKTDGSVVTWGDPDYIMGGYGG